MNENFHTYSVNSHNDDYDTPMASRIPLSNEKD